jgi:hypothetical protein
MKDRSMRNSPILVQTLAYAVVFAGFCGFGFMAVADVGADKPAMSSASLSSICEAYNKALAAEGGTEAKATAAATKAGGDDLLKDGPEALQAACLNLGVPLKALNAGGGGAELASQGEGKLVDNAPVPPRRDPVDDFRAKQQRAAGERLTQDVANNVGRTLSGDRVGYGDASTPAYEKGAQAARDVMAGVKTPEDVARDLNSFRTPLEREQYQQAARDYKNILNSTAGTATNGGGEIANKDQSASNLRTDSEGLGVGGNINNTGLTKDSGANVEQASAFSRPTKMQINHMAGEAARDRLLGKEFSAPQNDFFKNLNEDEKKAYASAYNWSANSRIRNATITIDEVAAGAAARSAEGKDFTPEQNRFLEAQKGSGWPWSKDKTAEYAEAYNKSAASSGQVATAPPQQAQTQPTPPQGTGGVRTREPQSQVSQDGNNYGYGNPNETRPPAANTPAPTTTADANEQARQREWAEAERKFGKTDAWKLYANPEYGSEATAEAFRNAKDNNDLARRIGAIRGDEDGRLTPEEVQAFKGSTDQETRQMRANLLTSHFEVEDVDKRIFDAAMNNTLTQSQIDRLGAVPNNTTPNTTERVAATDRITQIMATPQGQQPGQQPRDRQVDPCEKNPGQCAPSDPRSRVGKPADTGNKNDPLSQSLQQMGRGFGQQGGGGGSNQFGNQNPYNQFGNQFGQQCPTGTQLTYYNGQQACISTGQGQCPIGTTPAYSPTNNGGLFGLGGQQQVTCIPTGTAGNTCPTGQVPSVQANGITVCVTQTATNEASVREQAGYLDGVRVKDGVCGLGIDSRFSTDSNYLAGYNRGQAECRAGSGTTTPPKTVTKTNTNRDVSDARARAICQEQIGNVSKELKDTKGLFTLLFRERGALSDAEKTALGFDETIEKRLTTAKNQFDAGKADAVSIRDLDSDRQDNVSYREGYACGRKML